jgi:hypothetical protein
MLLLWQVRWSANDYTPVCRTLQGAENGWTLSGFSEISGSVVQATLLGHPDCVCHHSSSVCLYLVP